MNSKIVVFVIACVLGVGVLLVYAKNNMNNSDTVKKTDNLTTVSNSIPDNTSGVANNESTMVAGAQDQTVSKNEPVERDQVQKASNEQTAPQTQSQQPVSNPIPTGPITELMIRDILVGSGTEVKSGDNAEVNYVGTFLDGKKFDSSYDRNQTFTFKVGAGNVIRGWDQGVVGMKIGGKRQLIIPSDLAYGSAGAPGAIPPNTPLAFEVELVSINSSN